MKKLTLERVVPIISASISWLIFANHRLRFPFFAEVGQREKHPRQPLLTGVEALIDQVLLNPHVPGEQIGQEHLGKSRLVVEHTDHGRFLQSYDRAV